MTATVDAEQRLVRAPDLKAALDALAEPGTVPVAGGVGLLLRRHATGAPLSGRLVAVGGVPELRGIEGTAGGLRIGAAETLEAVANDAAVAAAWPIVAEACASVATERIRRLVTLGGNIAPGDAAHDPPVALAAAGARVLVAGEDGKLVTGVELPSPAAGTGSAFVKYLVRGVWEYACVAAGAVVRIDEARTVSGLRVALGSVGGTTLLVDAEDLTGRPFGDDLLDEVAERARAACAPVSDVRGSADYKREMVARFVRRSVRLAVERAEGSRT